MILNSKQLEELENIQDSSGEFEEESGDSDGYVEGVENALAWRRGMIERAVANIRKLVRKPMESMDGLVTGSIVFLKESKRFVRIHENQDGHTELSFVSPAAPIVAYSGKAAKPVKVTKPSKEKKANIGTVLAKPEPAQMAVKDNAMAVPKGKLIKEKSEPKKPVPASKTKPETNKKSTEKKADAKVKAKDTPVKQKTGIAKKADSKTVTTTKLKTATKSKKVSIKPSKKSEKAGIKAKPKKKAPEKAVPKSKVKATPKKMAGKKKHKKSALVGTNARQFSSNIEDPVADPNGYIRGNFRLMSNKELSHVTGLSEHTIRRKLGEWGLRRI